MKNRYRWGDGPRKQPVTRKTPDDRHRAMVRRQNMAAYGRDREADRLLAGWLRGELWGGCLGGCGQSLGWRGRWEDMPQCPKCQHIADLDELRRRDAEFAERSRAITVKECRCKKEMGFVVNVATGKEGPVDLRSIVYVVFLPAKAGGPVGESVVFEAMTGKGLSESGGRIVFPDGREVALSDVRLYASHYSTCPCAAHFSANGGFPK